MTVWLRPCFSARLARRDAPAPACGPGTREDGIMSWLACDGWIFAASGPGDDCGWEISSPGPRRSGQLRGPMSGTGQRRWPTGHQLHGKAISARTILSLGQCEII